MRGYCSAIQPGVKNVVFSPNHFINSRMQGVPTLTSNCPPDRAIGSSRPREIQDESASMS